VFYFLGEVAYKNANVKLFFLPCLSSLNPSDVTETDEVTHEKSKPPPCGDSPAEPEAGHEASTEPMAAAEAVDEPESATEAVDEPESATEPEPTASPDPDAVVTLHVDSEPEADAEPETEVAETEAEAMDSSKEAEDDLLSVSIPNEDAITLDVDGDDLLETGKHVKLPDPDKGTDDSKAPPPMGLDDDDDDDDDLNTEETGGHKDGKSDAGSKIDPMKKESREALKKAETGDKGKDSGKKGPISTGASGQAKRFVFLCQFFDSTTTTTTKFQLTKNTALWVGSRSFIFVFFSLREMFAAVPNPDLLLC